MRYKDRTGKEVCANGQQDALLQKMYGTALGLQAAVSVSSACCFKNCRAIYGLRLVCCIGFPICSKKSYRSVTI